MFDSRGWPGASARLQASRQTATAASRRSTILRSSQPTGQNTDSVTTSTFSQFSRHHNEFGLKVKSVGLKRAPSCAGSVPPCFFSGALCLSIQHESYYSNRIQMNWLLHFLHKETERYLERRQRETGQKKAFNGTSDVCKSMPPHSFVHLKRQAVLVSRRQGGIDVNAYTAPC